MDDFIVTYLTGQVNTPQDDPRVEELTAWAKDRAAVDLFLDKGELRNHPRLRRIEITAPDGTVERIQA
jgi:hypothetical protein